MLLQELRDLADADRRQAIGEWVTIARNAGSGEGWSQGYEAGFKHGHAHGVTAGLRQALEHAIAARCGAVAPSSNEEDRLLTALEEDLAQGRSIPS